MQKDNFFNRMTGRGELPISKMAGLHPPEDEEHEYIVRNAERHTALITLRILMEFRIVNAAESSSLM